jgi:serine/threonine protein kinase
MLNSSRRPLEAIVRDGDGRQIARCLIKRGRYIIGHERKNEIVAEDPSVSSRHARLTVVDDEEMFIEDLESANGTLVGGQSVEGVTPVPLGARVSLGLCTLDFQRSGLPAAVFQYLPPGFLRESRYNLGEPVVEGSTSTIFTAFDTTLGRDVAIKVMRPESQQQVEHVLRFIREAQITAQIQHPGVLTVYELGLNDRNQLYYTTCFVEGGTLADVLDALATREPGAPERFPLLRLLVAFEKICDALALAHSRGIVHAALRPDMVSLGFYGEVVVIGWCYARLLGTNAEGQELPRRVLAAPSESAPPLSAFTPPEIATESWDAVSARSDVYSLGAILYRLVTLHRPFTFEDPTLLRDAIIHGDIRKPAQFASEPHPHCPHGRYPADLMGIALKAMSPDPADRYATVPEFQTAILDWERKIGH